MKRKTIQKWKQILYYCNICKEYKPEHAFPKWRNGGKVRIHSYCYECEKKRTNKRANEESRKKSIIKYKASERWKIRQKIDDYLYKKDKNFIKSKKILEELWEWEKMKKMYKRNYIMFNIPEEIFSKEEKMIALWITEEEWKKYYYSQKPKTF